MTTTTLTRSRLPMGIIDCGTTCRCENRPSIPWEHATNVGTMFRGREDALQDNWLHVPIVVPLLYYHLTNYYYLNYYCHMNKVDTGFLLSNIFFNNGSFLLMGSDILALWFGYNLLWLIMDYSKLN